MSGIIDWLSGASSQANKVGSYYQNAENQLINSTGSPAATAFAAEYTKGLQPGFQQQDNALAAMLAAQGITSSGAAKNDYSQLFGDQSSAEASGIAPFYQQAEGQYGSLLGAGAQAQSGAYTDAMQQFYSALTNLGEAAAGAPSTSTPVTGGMSNPYQGGFTATDGTQMSGYDPSTGLFNPGGTGLNTAGLPSTESAFSAPTLTSAGNNSSFTAAQNAYNQPWNPYSDGS